MRQSIAPADPREALQRIADALHLLPGANAGAGVVDAIWLRNAIRARLGGEAESLDQALGLRGPQPREICARRRAANIRKLAQTTGVRSPWGAANVVALLLRGDHQPHPDQAELVQALRADPKASRSARHIYRLLREGATDTPWRVRVSAPPPAPIARAARSRTA